MPNKLYSDGHLTHAIVEKDVVKFRMGVRLKFSKRRGQEQKLESLYMICTLIYTALTVFDRAARFNYN